MRINAVTAEVAKKFVSDAKNMPSLKVEAKGQDRFILADDGKTLAWVFPSKKSDDNIHMIAWRDDEETDVMMNQMLRQVT